MKQSFLVLLSSLCMNILFAQHATVFYEYQTNSFNQNQALPAEKFMTIQGSTSSKTEMVKIELLNNIEKKDVVYQSYWKRPFKNTEEAFIVPFNYKFRSNAQVTLAIKYFRFATPEEQEVLNKELLGFLNSYIEQAFSVQGKKISLVQQKKVILKELNNIAAGALSQYEHRNFVEFQGFSSIVESKLSEIENLKLKNAKHEFTEVDKEKGKNMFREKAIKQLQVLIQNEIKQYLNDDLLVLDDLIYVYDYPVEKTKNTIALHGGYSGVFLGKTNGTSLDYDHAPMIGVSIPFGNKNLRKQFWHNLTFDFGVMLTNLEDANGERISGPVVQRPLYGGLGYKFFRFIKVQAGYTLLEYQGTGNSFLSTKDIAARPYVGVGIQINFWADFAK